MATRTSVEIRDQRAAAMREAAETLARRQRDRVRRATVVADFTWETAQRSGTALVYGVTADHQRVALRFDGTGAAKLVEAWRAAGVID